MSQPNNLFDEDTPKSGIHGDTNIRDLLPQDPSHQDSVVQDPFQQDSGVQDPSVVRDSVLKDPFQQGSGIQDPSVVRDSVLKDPFQQGSGIQNPSAVRDSVLKDPFQQGSGIQNPSVVQDSVLKDPFQQGSGIQNPYAVRDSVLKDPFQQGSGIQNPYAVRNSVVQDPFQQGSMNVTNISSKYYAEMKITPLKKQQSFDAVSSIHRDPFIESEQKPWDETSYIAHKKQPNTQTEASNNKITEDINIQSTIQDNKNTAIQREFDHLTQYVQTKHQAILDEMTRVHQKIKTILKI